VVTRMNVEIVQAKARACGVSSRGTGAARDLPGEFKGTTKIPKRGHWASERGQ
jgi:hypothetical protein